MTRQVSRFTEMLNGPIATALTRGIVIGAPFVGGLLLYAGHSWLNEQIAAAPVVTALAATDAKIQAVVDQHEVRFNNIEATAKVAASTSSEVTRKLDETQRDVKDISRQLNRLVGAIESRRIIQPTQP